MPAVAAVLVLTGANCLGIARTARLTRVLVALTLLALVAVVVATLGGGAADPANLAGWSDAGIRPTLQAAALLFFAFAGYARIATLGEEVRDPERTIPRAIPIALAVVVAVYAVVGVAALSVLGPTGLATAAAPLAEATSAGSLGVLTPAVRIGGALASAGVLLSLLAGVGRTTLAMARDRELPGALAAVHERSRVPARVEILLAVLVIGIVLVADPRAAIGASSFAVLVYYGVANASALTLDRSGAGCGRSRRSACSAARRWRSRYPAGPSCSPVPCSPRACSAAPWSRGRAAAGQCSIRPLCRSRSRCRPRSPMGRPEAEKRFS